MEIRTYENVQKLPGDYTSELSEVFITSESLMAEEQDSELRDFLLALLEINLRLTAHVFLDRRQSSLGGSKIRIVITTTPTLKGIIWGIGYDPSPEGGQYVESIHVDVDISKVGDDFKEEYKLQKKDFEGWKKFFLNIFEMMREESKSRIKRSEELLICLTPIQTETTQ